ncbi:MAG: hypothetical protein AB4038_01650, partial [Prochloraceae cyanobacterium]
MTTTNFQAFQPIFPEMGVSSNRPSSKYNTSMKVKGEGQGKVLTANELKRLFELGLVTSRDLEEIREAGRCLFAICLFTG